MKNLVKNAFHRQRVYSRYIRRKGWKRFLRENILETEGSNKTKALSVALGIFVGLTPLFGFHTIIVLFLASVFRLNKIISYMGTHISFPAFIPFIIMISLWLGGLFLPNHPDLSQMEFTMETVKKNLVQYLIGSTILAISASVLLGALTFFILNFLQPEKKS